MNKSIYKAAGELSSCELNKDRGAYFGSIIGTLNHIVVGDIFWFKRFSEYKMQPQVLGYFRNIENPSSLNAILHEDFPSLALERERMDEHILQFASELTDEVIASTLSYKNTEGIIFSKNTGHLLQHVFNHQTHHRGQLSTLLYQAGIDVGVTDMLALIPND